MTRYGENVLGMGMINVTPVVALRILRQLDELLLQIHRLVFVHAFLAAVLANNPPMEAHRPVGPNFSILH